MQQLLSLIGQQNDGKCVVEKKDFLKHVTEENSINKELARQINVCWDFLFEELHAEQLKIQRLFDSQKDTIAAILREAKFYFNQNQLLISRNCQNVRKISNFFSIQQLDCDSVEQILSQYKQNKAAIKSRLLKKGPEGQTASISQLNVSAQSDQNTSKLDSQAEEKIENQMINQSEILMSFKHTFLSC